MSATRCTYRTCRNHTENTSGRCYAHGNPMQPHPTGPKKKIPIPELLGRWKPGSGTPHPTGGYDDVVLQDGGVTVFYLGGIAHRIDGPAVEQFRDGRFHCREWFVNGERHRLDGPAIERYHRDGSMWTTAYRRNGKSYRADGGATNEAFYESGWQSHAIYRDEQERYHRLDGPALTRWSEKDGSVEEEVYVIRGIEYTAEGFAAVRELLDAGAPLEWVLAYLDADQS